MRIYHHGAWHTVTPDSGVVAIERGSYHGFTSVAGVRCVLKETASPAGEYKVEFFRDVSEMGGEGAGMWGMARVAFDHDLYLWVGRWRWVDWMVC